MCEIISKLGPEWSFKSKVKGRMDGRRTKTDHKSSPCHFVTGELKRQLVKAQTKTLLDGNVAMDVKSMTVLILLPHGHTF